VHPLEPFPERFGHQLDERVSAAQASGKQEHRTVRVRRTRLTTLPAHACHTRIMPPTDPQTPGNRLGLARSGRRGYVIRPRLDVAAVTTRTLVYSSSARPLWPCPTLLVTTSVRRPELRTRKARRSTVPLSRVVAETVRNMLVGITVVVAAIAIAVAFGYAFSWSPRSSAQACDHRDAVDQRHRAHTAVHAPAVRGGRRVRRAVDRALGREWRRPRLLGTTMAYHVTRNDKLSTLDANAADARATGPLLHPVDKMNHVRAISSIAATICFTRASAREARAVRSIERDPRRIVFHA